MARKKKTTTPTMSSTLNEQLPDAPQIEKPTYPGYESLGTLNNVEYLQGKGQVCCVKDGRFISMGNKFSQELLAKLK